MRKRITMLLICLLLVVGGTAQDSRIPLFKLMKNTELAFSQAPLRVENTVTLPRDRVLVFFFAEGKSEGEESYWLNLFNENGDILLAKEFCSFCPEDFVFPYVQALLGEKGFTLEFYPDISSMEVYYRSAYTFDGKQVKADKKYTQKFGDAFYAQNLAPFIVKKRAHAYDEEGTSPYLDLIIEHVPTGKTIKTQVWDVMFCPFLDESGDRLWLAQKNEQGKLGLRLYSLGFRELTERIFAWDEVTLETNENAYLCSGAVHNGKVMLLLRLSNTEYTLLFVDIEKEEVISRNAVHALPSTDYIQGFLPGSWQILVHGAFDEATQTFEKRLGVLSGEYTINPITTFWGQAFSVWINQEGNIETLEMDKDSGLWWLREYWGGEEKAKE